LKIIFLLPQLVYGSQGGFVGGYVNSVINLMEVLQSECELSLVAGIAKPSQVGPEELACRLARTRLHLLTMRQASSTSAYFAEFALKALGVCRDRIGLPGDVVYGHSGHPGYGVVTWLAARVAGARAVHALYCPVSEEFQHRKRSWLDRLISYQALRHVPATVAISNNVKESVARFTNYHVQPHILRPAIPDDLITRSTKNGALPRSKQLVAGFVGHHKPEKGFDLALGAVKQALSRGNQISLLALTSGAESQGSTDLEIETMLKTYGLQEHARVVRGIKDIRDFYSQVDLMLIPFRGTRGPSDYPMVLLEAMSLGVPVVCTRVGAISEVVTDGVSGFLAREANVESFNAALNNAIDSLRQRRGDVVASALKAVAQFRATAVSGATQQFLESLLAEQ
jgi:glycosyltransferase involved in cell wall biosynthesis